MVQLATGVVLESSVEEQTPFNISATKQIVHHGSTYGLLEYSMVADESLLRNCTLQIMYGTLVADYYMLSLLQPLATRKNPYGPAIPETTLSLFQS